MTTQRVIQVSLIIALVWQIWMMHILGWPEWKQEGKGKQEKKRQGAKKKKKKSEKPFEGLTRKPECELCEAEAKKQEKEVKQEPPPMIERERGRKPEIDTSKHFCPREGCLYYGWLGRRNIISNGRPNGGPWRQLRCVWCGKHFQETIGTVFYGSSISAEDIMRAIATLCEGMSPRKVARVFKVDKDTVLGWLVEAAKHSEAVIAYMIHNLELTQVQMDELYALLSGMRGEGEKRWQCWVWTAMDSFTKLWLAVEVGDRSLDMAQRLVHGVVSVLSPGVVPMFLTDQLASYEKAILAHFGFWIERVSEKSGRTLRRWMSVEQLRYAQVKKKRRRRKIVAVTTRVVYGTKELVASALAKVGHKINTAFIERLNRTLRSHVPGLGRREEGLAKTKEGLLGRLRLVMGYYNFCLPHLSLREELPKPIPTKGNGSPKKWMPRTPAMAAGITDHVWTMGEFLLFRVPPWRQEGAVA